MSDLPSIIGGLALLITAVFGGLAGLEARRGRRDAEVAEELEQRQRWSPRVLRAVTMLRDAFARIPGAVEPEGIDDLIAYPPPAKSKHAREMSGDDEE
jgi:hypothetical protein